MPLVNSQSNRTSLQCICTNLRCCSPSESMWGILRSFFRGYQAARMVLKIRQKIVSIVNSPLVPSVREMPRIRSYLSRSVSSPTTLGQKAGAASEFQSYAWVGCTVRVCSNVVQGRLSLSSLAPLWAKAGELGEELMVVERSLRAKHRQNKYSMSIYISLSLIEPLQTPLWPGRRPLSTARRG